MNKIQRHRARKVRNVSQTTISPAFQTTISAEAVRALRLRPGMKLSQTVEGDRLILEPLRDLDSLAGSLGVGGKPRSLPELAAGAKAGIAKAGRKGV